MTLPNKKTLEIKGKIEQFLNDHRTPRGVSEFTHVSMGGVLFPGKYIITDKKDRSQLARYIGLATDDGLKLSIAEKLKPNGPILVDIDLRFPQDQHQSVDRLYDDKFVLTLINKYRDALKYYFQSIVIHLMY